jgi:DNA-binding transcriptional LysR family regulator
MRTNLGLRQLESIVAIADCKSFSAAAEKMHVSQPALSRTIRLAEESLGARVFDRDTRSVSLTPAGTELLPIARRIVLEFLDSMSELSQFMEGRRGRIRVGALPSMSQSLLVDAIAGFAKIYPEIEFLIRVDTADDVLLRLENRECDVGLTVQPPPDGRFTYQHLVDEEFVLICRRDDPVLHGFDFDQPLPWRIFEGRQFIAATPGSNTRRATDSAFMQAGLTIRPAHEVASSNLTVIGSLVAGGLGLSVLPAGTMACLNQVDLVGRRLTKPVVRRKVGVVTLGGRTMSLAVSRFCEHLLHSRQDAARPPSGGRHTSRRSVKLSE